MTPRGRANFDQKKFFKVFTKINDPPDMANFDPRAFIWTNLVDTD
jgi:hypothetical protein